MTAHLLLFWGQEVSREFRKPPPPNLICSMNIWQWNFQRMCSLVLGRASSLEAAAYGRPVGGTLGRWEKCDFLATMHSFCQPEAGPLVVAAGGEIEQEPLSIGYANILGLGLEPNEQHGSRGNLHRAFPCRRLAERLLPSSPPLPEFCENTSTTWPN